MSEHHEGYGFRIPNGFVDIGGSQREIVVNNTTYYMEFHHYCGPMRLTKSGMSHQKDFPRHVWSAIQNWIDQGKRMDGDVCVWEARP